MTFRLVYVDEPWAWFTTLPIEDQWGDDWNDAPYEHNAGEPYGWTEHRGLPRYELLRVAYVADLQTPREGRLNSDWSVQQINARETPWLRVPDWHPSWVGMCLWAGLELPEFFRLVSELDGQVFVPALTISDVEGAGLRP